MGKDEQIRCGTGIVSDQLQGVRQAGFLLKDNFQIRHGGFQIVFQCGNKRVFFVVPDDQFVRLGRVNGRIVAGWQPQKDDG